MVAALAVGMLVGVAVVPVGQPRAEGEPARPAYVGAPYFAPGAVYTQNFPDPSILFDPVTDLYYAYGTTTGGVNVPVMTSPDAVTWTARSRHAIANPNGEYHDGLPDPSPPGWPWQSGDARFPDDLWAPGVTKLGSRWVMFYALRENQAGRRCIVYATSASPAGPFGDAKRFSCSADPLGSIDPAALHRSRHRGDLAGVEGRGARRQPRTAHLGEGDHAGRPHDGRRTRRAASCSSCSSRGTPGRPTSRRARRWPGCPTVPSGSSTRGTGGTPTATRRASPSAPTWGSPGLLSAPASRPVR